MSGAVALGFRWDDWGPSLIAGLLGKIGRMRRLEESPRRSPEPQSWASCQGNRAKESGWIPSPCDCGERAAQSRTPNRPRASAENAGTHLEECEKLVVARMGGWEDGGGRRVGAGE